MWGQSVSDNNVSGHAEKWTNVSPWYVVNPALEEAYERRKMEMTARRGDGGVNERLLFHGTSLANSEGIIRENFRLDKAGFECAVQGLILVHFSAQCKHFLWDTSGGFSSVLQYRWDITRHKLDTKRLTDQSGLG